MPPAVAIAGAAVVGAGASIYAGNKAAKAQKAAANAAAESSAAGLEEQRRQYDTTRADYAPYREVGYGALDKLAGMYGVGRVDANGKPTGAAGSATPGYSDGGFTASPGYGFRRDEGLKAIDRSNAARGILNSGGADKARMRYADGLASSEFDAYNSRLMALAGVGQSATGSTAQAGANFGNAATTAAGQIGAAQTAAGNATAAGYANVGSSINSGINNLAASYLYSKSPGFGAPPTGTGYGTGPQGGGMMSFNPVSNI